MGPSPDGQQPQQNEIPGQPPQPLPTTITVTTTYVQVMTEDGPKVQGMVQMFVSTPVGMGIYFMDSDMANKVGHNIILHAKQAKTGLHLPPGISLGAEPTGGEEGAEGKEA